MNEPTPQRQAQARIAELETEVQMRRREMERLQWQLDQCCKNCDEARQAAYELSLDTRDDFKLSLFMHKYPWLGERHK